MKQTPESPKTSGDAQNQFFSAAWSMSWQLAIVVLVPIIGGYELDKQLDMLPLLTITGFLLAMIGFAGIVWRQMQVYSPTNTTNPNTTSPSSKLKSKEHNL